MSFLAIAVAFIVGIVVGVAILGLAVAVPPLFTSMLGFTGIRTVPVQRAPRAGKSAKMSKRKPAPDEEPKKETTSDEESGDEINPDDEPKKEKTSDEESRNETNPGGSPSDHPGDSPNDDSGGSPSDDPGGSPNDHPGGSPNDDSGGSPNGNSVIGTVFKAAATAGLAVAAPPLVVSMLGFTGAGIAAGSFAAKMMSAAAIANGGGVAAGSTVAVLQSIGAAGLSLGTKIGLGTAGAATGAWLFKPKEQNPKKDKNPSDEPKKNNLGDKHEEETTPDQEPRRSQAGA